MKKLLVAAVVLGAAAGAQAGLINGGFEQLLPTTLPVNGITITSATNVPGWKTTATDNQIEIWSTAFNGVSAYEGKQFAELNANQVSTLYQDATGIAAGAVVGYQFAHRGRAGTDTMNFVLTDLGVDGVFGTSDDTVLLTRIATDGNNAWGFYAGTGIVALGNTVRFSFVSVSAAGGASVGNFLDAADFGVGVGNVPEPASIALVGLALLAASRRTRRS
jgi:hypothetical protein